MFFKNKRNDLKTLVKNESLANLKSIVENDDQLLTTTDSSGMTILHLAVKYQKLDLIKYLLTSKRIDINAQDSSGTTPILMAFRDKLYKAVNLLMIVNPHIAIPNQKGETTLTYVVKYGLFNLPGHTMTKYRDKFFEVHERAPEHVVWAMYRSVSLMCALTLNCSEFLTVVLESKASISCFKSQILVVAAMCSSYLDNLRVLLTFGPGARERRKILLKELDILIKNSDTDLNFAKILVKKLIEWNMITQTFVIYFSEVFKKGHAKAIKMLFESGIVEYVKQWTDVDLTAHLFSNKNQRLTQVLHNREFDVNTKGVKGYSPLHFAVKASSKKNILFLLNKSADINITDDFDATPIFKATSPSVFMLLLSRGADIQVFDDRGCAAFEYDIFFSERQQNILGHLAILKEQGLTISQEIFYRIQSKDKFEYHYDQYRSYVKRMKKYMICESLSMFNILTEDPKDIERYVRYNRKDCKINMILAIPFLTELWFKNQYYFFRIQHNMSLAWRIADLKVKALEIVSQSIRLYTDNYLIIHKIVYFLSYEDLCVIFK